MSLLLTASQTVGPFLSIVFEPSLVGNVAPPGVSGTRIVIRGRVLDGDGNPVSDAAIETWQANAHGKYAHPDDVQEKLVEDKFKGFGRVLTSGDGAFQLATIKPGRVPGPGGVLQAPHVVAIVFMRGLLKHLLTRIYFPDDPANAEDPVLSLVPPERRATLIAKHVNGEQGMLEWNVRLQGSDETVFFDY
jgi:protocatechuate 3,4-dioxygenase, alpha subunit